MSYEIVCISDKICKTALELLAEAVNNRNNDGYKPIGGISLICKDGVFFVCQAIIQNKRIKECFPGRD